MMAGNDNRHEHFRIKIAVSGAAETAHCGDGTLESADQLGREIARQGAICVTGATTGFPFWSAKGAKMEGGVSIGLSPAQSEREHIEKWALPIDYMDMIIYTGSGFAMRDILLTRSSDAVVIGCGRIGTFHEFTVAFEDAKPIGILKGPWTSDELIKEIIDASNRSDDNTKIFFEEDPKVLIQKLIAQVQEDKKEYTKEHISPNSFSNVCEGPDCPEPVVDGKKST